MKKLYFFLISLVCLAWLVPSRVFAISLTNVQPSNLVQSNEATVTVTFTNAITIPPNGKIKVIFPVGFDVSAATGGTCSTINGGFTTTVSGQTVTITRDNTGSSATGAAQSCTINRVKNPSSTGSTGAYTISLQTSSDVVLEEDTAVTADTIIAAGALSAVSVVPENLVAGVRSRYTVGFTTVNAISREGRIAVTFPAGFNVSGAVTPACSTIDGGFSVSTSGQTVILTRNGAGTVQTTAAESCTIFGINAPTSTGAGGTYTVATQDRFGNATDQNAAVTSTTFVAAGTLTSTNVQPASLVAGAFSTVTMSFTTVATTTVFGKVRVVFPSGFDISAAGTLTCATLTGTVSYTTSSQTLVISRSGSGSSEAPGAESCTLTNIRNPQVSGSTGTYSIEVLDDQSSPATVGSDMAVAADVITVGTLTSTNVQPENLVVSNKTISAVTFTTANPLPAGTSTITVTYPATYSLASATSGTCYVIGGSYATAVSGTTQVVLTRTNGSAVAAGTAVTCEIKDIVSPGVAGASAAYAIQTGNASGTAIDSAAPAGDTFVVVPALTVANVQPISLVRNVVSDHDITFTTAQNIPQEAKIKITYGAGFVVAGATSGTCTGFDGVITTSVSGQTVTLTRDATGTMKVAGAIACRVYGVKNPSALGSAGTYTITVTDKADTNVGTLASVTADTVVIDGALTSTDVQPSSLVAGATGSVTTIYTTAVGLPSDGKVKVTFPSGFDVSAASGGACVGFAGGVLTSVTGTTVTLQRDNTAVGLASGSFSCSVFNVRNPVVSGSTGLYTITTTDLLDTIIASSTAVTADAITAGAISLANIEPETRLVGTFQDVTVTGTLSNPVAANGKLVVIFPAGFSLASVSSTDFSCSSGLDGSFTVSTSSNTMTALRSGGTTSATGAALNCRLRRVRNPNVVGSAGTYTLRTTTFLDATIDQNSLVSSDTFSATGTLTSTNVQPTSLLTGTSNQVAVSFTTTLGIPRDGKILVTFPPTFTVDGATAASCSTMDGTYSTLVSGTTVTILRNGDGTATATGTQACTINNVINPTGAVAAGTYAIETRTSADELLDQDAAVASDTFLNSPASVVSSGGGGGGGGSGSYWSSLPLPGGVMAPLYLSRQDRIAKLPVAVHALVKIVDDGNPKTQEDSVVYYIGGDGYRHAFPDARVFFTWYCDFSQVKTVTAAQLASVSLGQNVTYRPGALMVKFTTDPKVYVVQKNGVLRGIKDEDMARALYGSGWAREIRDISDAFYTNYTFGAELSSFAEFDVSATAQSVANPSDSLAIQGYEASRVGTALSCPVSSSASTPGTFTLPTTFPKGFLFTQTVTVGAVSVEVRRLQEFLVSQGEAIYPEAKVTGIFGPATSAALKRLQAGFGLPQSGLLDRATREAINLQLKVYFDAKK